MVIEQKPEIFGVAFNRVRELSASDEMREIMRKKEKWEMDRASRDVRCREDGIESLAKALIAMGVDNAKINEAKKILEQGKK